MLCVVGILTQDFVSIFEQIDKLVEVHDRTDYYLIFGLLQPYLIFVVH